MINEFIQPAILIAIASGIGRIIYLQGKLAEWMVSSSRRLDDHDDDIDVLQVQANDLDGDVRVLESRLKSAGINGGHATVR